VPAVAQQHLPFFGLQTLTCLPGQESSGPPHLGDFANEFVGPANNATPSLAASSQVAVFVIAPLQLRCRSLE
jgi:hypothetical protein